jgi:hypothetical protein
VSEIIQLEIKGAKLCPAAEKPNGFETGVEP